MSEREWLPVLKGGEAEACWSLIREIAKAVRNPVFLPTTGSATGLAGGAAGIALFFYALHLALPNEGYDEDVGKFLDLAATAEDKRIVLFNGTPGIAWVTERLIGDWDGDPDPYDELDDLIASFENTWLLGDYDLISGIVGIGVYTLSRLPRPKARQNLGMVVRVLTAASQREARGISWFTTREHASVVTARTKQTYDKEVGHYNLGVAHGGAGVLAFLGAACATGQAPPEAEPLLASGVEWFLTQKDPSFGFGDIVYPGEPARSTRSAWCYGNPGIAVALMVAGRGAHRRDWVQAGEDLLLEEASRPIDRSGISDAGLCHGSMGLVHLYNRGFQATRDERLAEAARKWARHALTVQRQPGVGVAGFRSYGSMPGSTSPALLNDASLLTGAAGVGVSLLGLVSEQAPRWDGAFLMDIPDEG